MRRCGARPSAPVPVGADSRRPGGEVLGPVIDPSHHFLRLPTRARVHLCAVLTDY